MMNVLVTGIGGVVGQGILRNIRECGYDIRLTGTNTEEISGGNHLCDAVYQVPYSYEEGYIKRIVQICGAENIDLIIPSTDYESYYLAASQEHIPSVAGSPADTANTFLDKHLTWQAFTRHNIPFAETCLPDGFNGQFSEHIVKPRKGRGSRDIHINHHTPSSFSSDYIVQRLYAGLEITTAFYVTKKNVLLGHITLERTLSAGNTVLCHVTFDHFEPVDRLIRQMIGAFEIRGSCNIQSIVTKDGAVIPFEINCRISGTNSIRGQFGFKDVKYTIDEYLYNKELSGQPTISPGSAVRIFMDVIYPGTDRKSERNARAEHYIF